MDKKIKLGVIADDFTGAGDAASFLVKAGYKVTMLTDIVDEFHEICDGVVMAMKIRSIEPEAAKESVKRVLDFFEKIKVEKIYYKYCSTFDSTARGNIGVIADYLLDYLDVPFTVLCPSLPINGRTVKNGNLYVNGVPLAESPMKNHPLNPMWDSYIPTLMKEQSKYPCYITSKNDMAKKADELSKTDQKFYIIPDYMNDEDGKEIAKTFEKLRLYTGGSGLLEYLDLGDSVALRRDLTTKSGEKAIILCGSCSQMTKKQIQDFTAKENPFIKLDSLEVLSGKTTAEKVFAEVMKNLPRTTLVYSDGVEKDMEKFSKTKSFKKLSFLIEKLHADLNEMALKNGFDTIVAAGGETSGAVTLRLGYRAYWIGRVIAPGVPTLIPVEKQELRLVLKSGNFGDESFFTKALVLEG